MNEIFFPKHYDLHIHIQKPVFENLSFNRIYNSMTMLVSDSALITASTTFIQVFWNNSDNGTLIKQTAAWWLYSNAKLFFPIFLVSMPFQVELFSTVRILIKEQKNPLSITKFFSASSNYILEKWFWNCYFYFVAFSSLQGNIKVSSILLDILYSPI